MTIFESRSSQLVSAVGLMLLLAMAVSLVMIVPAEAKRKSLRLVLARRVQVDPGDAVLVELSEPRLWLRDDLAREAAGPDPLDAG